MQIILSPAKLMDVKKHSYRAKTTPSFLKESKELIQILKQKSIKEIADLMKLSDELAMLNKERYDQWTSAPKEAESNAAIFSFHGEVYRGLDAETLLGKGMAYAQQHIKILSGIYGILKPLDQIMPYRLEMGTRLENPKGTNLYQFWDEKLLQLLKQEMQPNEPLLNLASNEYAKVLQLKKADFPIMDVSFLDYKDGNLKKIMVYFKQARGAMARFCAENQIENIEEIKNFEGMGYQFTASESTENHWVFTR